MSYYYYFTACRFFYIIASRWFLTGIGVTASLLPVSSIQANFNYAVVFGGILSSVISKSTIPSTNPL